MKAQDIPIIIFRRLKKDMQCKARYLKGKDCNYSVMNLKENGIIILAKFSSYSILILAYDMVDKVDHDFLLIGGSDLTEQLIKRLICKLPQSFQRTHEFYFYYCPGLCLNAEKLKMPIIENVIDMIDDMLGIKE